MKTTLVLLCLVLACDSVRSQEGFSSVEERMTAQEFTAAGLDKLTNEELAALNRWLRDHSVGTMGGPGVSGNAAAATALGAVADKRGLAGAESNKDTIVSPLVGEFSGWDGKTIFQLANGMVWKQNESDKFFISTLTNPVVTIKAGFFNTWRLSVEGYNRSVKVKRIQ